MPQTIISSLRCFVWHVHHVEVQIIYWWLILFCLPAPEFSSDRVIVGRVLVVWEYIGYHFVGVEHHFVFFVCGRAERFRLVYKVITADIVLLSGCLSFCGVVSWIISAVFVILLIKFFWKPTLYRSDRAILAIWVRLEVLYTCQCCSLLKCIQATTAVIIFFVDFGLGVINSWSSVDHRVFKIHRIFRHFWLFRWYWSDTFRAILLPHRSLIGSRRPVSPWATFCCRCWSWLSLRFFDIFVEIGRTILVLVYVSDAILPVIKMFVGSLAINQHIIVSLHAWFHTIVTVSECIDLIQITRDWVLVFLAHMLYCVLMNWTEVMVLIRRWGITDPMKILIVSLKTHAGIWCIVWVEVVCKWYIWMPALINTCWR